MASLDRRLLRASRVARRHLVVAVLLGVATSVAVIAQAVLLARVVGRVFLDGASLGELRTDLLLFVAAAALRAALSWGFAAAGHLGAARAMSELRRRLVQRVLGPQPPELASERVGELAAVAVQGVDALDAYFSRYLPQVVLAALVPLAVLVWVVHVDLLAAVVMAATVPLIPVFMVLIGRAAERRAEARFRALTLLSGRFLDVVRGLPTLRAFGRADAQGAALAAAGDRYRRETMATLRVAFLSALVLELAAMLGTAVVAVMLGVRLTHGSVPFEQALAVLILAPELYLPLRQLGAEFHAAAEAVAPARRIFELTEAPAALSAPSEPRGQPDLHRETIRFDDVGFEYAARPGLVLDGVDLALRPGERVALVGPSGAGKSTMLSILLRFADPTAGRVSAGGVDLRDLDPVAWRAQVAWLPQRPHLFGASVADNIRVADASACDERVRAAAFAAGAAFVDDLPDGLETRVGEGGLPLSAGQTRRLALARAFLRDAPLLLLDEPTAHLDAATADGVAAAIERLAVGRTTLLVVHDPLLARRADRVVTLVRGRVALERAAA